MVTSSSSTSISPGSYNSFDVIDIEAGSELSFDVTNGSLILASDEAIQKTDTEKEELNVRITKIQKEKDNLEEKVDAINEELYKANAEKADLKARLIDTQEALGKSTKMNLSLQQKVRNCQKFLAGHTTYADGPTVYVGCGKMGAGSDSLRPGNIIALHSSCHNRFIRVMGEEVDGHGGTKDITKLPSDWTSERLTVVDGGDGQIAFYSDHHRQFIRLLNKYDVVTGAGETDMNMFPPASKCPSERFVVLDASEGKVSLFSRTHHRFLRMDSDGKVDAKGDILEPYDMLFTVLVLKDCNNDSLIPGSLVALHYPVHNRFLRLKDGQVNGKGGQKDYDMLPSYWKLERFRVVDAGEGTIALYNPYHRRFIVVTEDNNLIASSATFSVSDVQDLIDTGASVRFFAKELGEGDIHLYSMLNKAAVVMDKTGDVFTRKINHLPMIFKVLHLK